jgi:uncharacterized RDD family membrane protein YckC
MNSVRTFAKSKKMESQPLASGTSRFLAGMFDLSVLILGSVIIMVPSLLVFIDAMKHPSGERTSAVYLIMFLTGGLVALYDLLYRVAIPYFSHGESRGLRFLKLRMDEEYGTEIRLQSLLVKALLIFFLVLFTLGLYYLVEALVLFLNKNHRSFADTISQTIVVEEDDEE